MSFDRITSSPYLGRGIVQGVSVNGEEVVQLYWISGRSESSKARIFRLHGNDVRVSQYLIGPDLNVKPGPVYTAMSIVNATLIVSNGPQTEVIRQAMRGKFSTSDIGRLTRGKPASQVDAPRITGIINAGSRPIFRFSLVKPLLPSVPSVATWEYDLVPEGTGLCLTTYEGKGVEPTPFLGEPFVVPLSKTSIDLMKEYWNALAPSTRVCIALRIASLKNGRWRVFIQSRHHPDQVSQTEGRFDE